MKKCDATGCKTPATWHNSSLQDDGTLKNEDLCFEHSPLARELKGKELKQAKEYHESLIKQPA